MEDSIFCAQNWSSEYLRRLIPRTSFCEFQESNLVWTEAAVHGLVGAPKLQGTFIYNKFVGEQVKKHNVILPASDPGSVSNNAGRADDDKIISTSPTRLLSAHQDPTQLPRRHRHRGCGWGRPISSIWKEEAATNGTHTMRAAGQGHHHEWGRTIPFFNFILCLFNFSALKL